MSKIRVYQFAKELGLSSKDVITQMEKMNIAVTSHMSTIEDDDLAKLKAHYNQKKDKKADKPKKKVSPQEEKPANESGQKKHDKKKHAPQKNEDKKIEKDEDDEAPSKRGKRGQDKKASGSRRPKDYSKKKRKKVDKRKQRERREELREATQEKKVSIGSTVVLSELASLLSINPNELIMKFMAMGEMLTINAEVDYEIAEMIAGEYGYEVEKEKTEEELNELEFDFEDDPKDLKPRAPVVTVMGHVDHGKTSLLDAIRNTNVTGGEAGGITQHIGASEIKVNDKKVVFLDTPGHEAFTTLRARGAQVTDIAILVVAADDGVMPQTIEAIDHSKAAGVPIIVAINKMDVPAANPDRVKQELTEHGIVVEEWGGDVISVPVSAKTGENIETLLEMILLVAEMQELKANPSRPAIGTVIEAKLDKARGPLATILVENGSLEVGDPIFVGRTYGRIRAMINDKGKRIKKVGPSSSVEITGLNDVPVAGDRFYKTDDERSARLHAEAAQNEAREEIMKASRKNVTLEDIFSQIKDGEVKDLNIIIKADAHGSIEALKQSLLKLSNEEVRVSIIHSAVGTVTESDILLASASNAIIIGFNVRPTTNVTAVANAEEVEIRTYRIIYEAIKEVKDALSGLLEPEYKEVVEGTIEVRATFKVPNAGTIAGGYVTSGKVSRKSQVRLVREGIVIYEGSIDSLKRFKDDVREVATGYECGIGLTNYNDVKEGDTIEAFNIEEIKRTLD